MSNSYRDLIAWQKALVLVTEIYKWTNEFPRSETYGLQVQMQRAAVSVACNIAEGQARITVGERRQFLGHARGSLAELETQILVATNLGYFPADVKQSLAEKPGGRALAVARGTGR